MFDVFFQKAAALNAQGLPFALAIVVRHEPPISGKPGDKAIVQPDGSIFGVVATQGEDDEAALREALHYDVPHIAFVASRKKAEGLFQGMQEAGVPAEHLARVRVPAGLDIRAHLPEEIAVSILAEIIHVMRSTAPVAVAEASALAEAVDPVCGMPVDVASVRHTATYDGQAFYFCCPACKRTFEKAPEQYVTAATSA